jgi:methylated-DNA-protein-cysteine methyltransferase-like protein
MSDAGFARRVEFIVSQIPKGRVMTYGQIAGLAGNARASRIVGGIAHYGSLDIPWQRVVRKNGGLASGYPGGREGHKKDLEADGVEVATLNDEYRIDIEKFLWHPAQM